MTGHERVELRRQLASDVDSLVALVWPMVEAAFIAGEGEARKEAALNAYADARASAETVIIGQMKSAQQGRHLKQLRSWSARLPMLTKWLSTRFGAR